MERDMTSASWLHVYAFMRKKRQMDDFLLTLQQVILRQIRQRKCLHDRLFDVWVLHKGRETILGNSFLALGIS